MNNSLKHLLEPAHTLLRSYTRHFPIDKGKNRLIEKFGKRLSQNQPLRRTHLTLPPVQMECDLRQYIQRQIYFRGTYEPDLLRLWLKLAENAPIIFDIGANVGIFTLAALSANPNAAVHAFEPTPDVCAKLRNNLALNGYDTATVNQIGVSDEQGTFFLNISTGSGGDNEGMNFVTREIAHENALEIPVTTLDAYCETRGLASISLVKIDIEGSEAAALKGAAALLAQKKIGVLFVEAIDWAARRSGQKVVDVLLQLKEHGYQTRQFDNGILSPLETMDHLTSDTIVAFAGDQIETSLT